MHVERPKMRIRLAAALVCTACSGYAQSGAPAEAPGLIAYRPLATNAKNIAADTNHGDLRGNAVFQDGALALDTNAVIDLGATNCSLFYRIRAWR